MLAFAVLLLLIGGVGGVELVTISDTRTGDSNEDARSPYRRLHRKELIIPGSAGVWGIALHSTKDDEEHWSVTAPLVYALPNQGKSDGLINANDIRDNIVLFDRGDSVTIAEQMFLAQALFAVAVIVIDFPNNNAKRTALRAAIDADSELWQMLEIPAVVVDFAHGARLSAR